MAYLSRFFLVLAALLLLPSHALAFGAGNIASISAVEGKNWRHGDIEDMLKTIVCLSGHKWTATMIKRVYFGNWLRDYSQAMDVGTLKSLPAETIRILVWILSFLTFGLATEEFEVTSERLGVYRPEEHIDNPKDYADNEDVRKYDARLRPPVRQVELDIDPRTGMKNYIANERGDWATSTAYIRSSFSRSIHFGRKYTSGGWSRDEKDLCEALRCLGQGLHTMEDFSAHTNYCELALREMGFHNVFPHTGTATQITLHGHRVFPLVTGTFGMVDFLHSVLGEATDHFTQSEINEMDNALVNAQSNSGSFGSLNTLTGLLGKIPGTRDLVSEAEELKARSEAQMSANRNSGAHVGYTTRGQPDQSFARAGSSGGHFDYADRGQPDEGFAQAGSGGAHFGYADRGQPDQTFARAGGSGANVSYPQYEQPVQNVTQASNQPANPLADFDPKLTIQRIYPILEFRDKVVRRLTSVIEKIPGLEALVDKISETLTVFVMSLLAPFIRPLINAASKSLQTGSSGVIDASGKHQYEPWTDPNCTDPTHSLLSKDHFTNILNEPAGLVASAVLRYVAPRILYAWEHPEIPEQQVLEDCVQVFHHPALRNMHNEAHRTMYEAVQKWVHDRPDRGANLNDILSAEGVRAGKNNTEEDDHTGHHFSALGGGGHAHGHHQPQHHQGPHHQGQQHHGQHHQGQHSQSSGLPSLPWDAISKLPIPGVGNLQKLEGTISSFIPGGLTRELETEEGEAGYRTSSGHPPPPGPPSSDYPSGSAEDYYSQPPAQTGQYYPQDSQANYNPGYGQGGHGQYPPYPHGQGHGYGHEHEYGRR